MVVNSWFKCKRVLWYPQAHCYNMGPCQEQRRKNFWLIEEKMRAILLACLPLKSATSPNIHILNIQTHSRLLIPAFRSNQWSSIWAWVRKRSNNNSASRKGKYTSVKYMFRKCLLSHGPVWLFVLLVPSNRSWSIQPPTNAHKLSFNKLCSFIGEGSWEDVGGGREWSKEREGTVDPLWEHYKEVLPLLSCKEEETQDLTLDLKSSLIPRLET